MKTLSFKLICHLLLFLVKKTNCTELPQDCQSQILLNQQSYYLSLSQFSYLMARDWFLASNIHFISLLETPIFFCSQTPKHSFKERDEICLHFKMKATWALPKSRWQEQPTVLRQHRQGYLRATYFYWMASEWQPVSPWDGVSQQEPVRPPLCRAPKQ